MAPRSMQADRRGEIAHPRPAQSPLSPAAQTTRSRTVESTRITTAESPRSLLTIVDEFTHEFLAIDVARNLTSDHLLERLCWLMTTRGVPKQVRSDNGPEFTAKVVPEWLARVGVTTLFIEPGSPWENGYVESSNGSLRDELLNREIFNSLNKAKVLIEQWRREYNTVRPQSSVGYRPPAPQVFTGRGAALGAHDDPARGVARAGGDFWSDREPRDKAGDRGAGPWRAAPCAGGGGVYLLGGGAIHSAGAVASGRFDVAVSRDRRGCARDSAARPVSSSA